MKRWGVAAATLAVIVAVAVLAHRNDVPSGGGVTLAPARGGAEQAQPLARTPVAAVDRSLSQPQGATPVSPPPSVPPPSVPLPALGSGELPRFEVDERGSLVLGAQTRNELERLLALNDRDEAQALLQKSTAALPPAAAREATDAYFAWQNYSAAVTREFPPQQPVTDEAGAARQLDALHALRVQQFGPDAAQAYFGEEEATARRLLAEMQSQRAAGGGGTFQERAEQAQQQAPPTGR